MSAVRTTAGTLVRATTPGDQDKTPLTPEAAEAIAVECNERAEQLGLQARYEVTEK